MSFLSRKYQSPAVTFSLPLTFTIVVRSEQLCMCYPGKKRMFENVFVRVRSFVYVCAVSPKMRYFFNTHTLVVSLCELRYFCNADVHGASFQVDLIGKTRET